MGAAGSTLVSRAQTALEKTKEMRYYTAKILTAVIAVIYVGTAVLYVFIILDSRIVNTYFRIGFPPGFLFKNYVKANDPDGIMILEIIYIFSLAFSPVIMFAAFMTRDWIWNLILGIFELVCVGIPAVISIIVVIIIMAAFTNDFNEPWWTPCNDPLFCCHPEAHTTFWIVTQCPNFNQSCASGIGEDVSNLTRPLKMNGWCWARLLLAIAFFVGVIVNVGLLILGTGSEAAEELGITETLTSILTSTRNILEPPNRQYYRSVEKRKRIEGNTGLLTSSHRNIGKHKKFY